MIQTPNETQHKIKSHITQTINLPRNRKINELEAPSSVTWVGDWEPDNKYIKLIKLKNNSLRLLKVNFTSPLTRTFSTPYPSQTIELAAGSSKELPIYFRPTESIPYSDSITLSTRDSGLRNDRNNDYVIRLQAKIPTPKLDFPNLIEFEPCAIGNSLITKFLAKNKSSLDTRYKWLIHPPEFTIEPSEGIITQENKELFEIKFNPNIISHHKGIAECRFGPEFEYSRTINLTGSAQFPQIFVKNKSKYENSLNLDFGIVENGKSILKKVMVYNLSSCTAHVILVEGSGSESEFECQIKSAEIKPNSSFQLPILFRPNLVDNIRSFKCFRLVDRFDPGGL
jgi:hypothetical protein